MIHSGVFFGRNAVKASETVQDVRWTSALRGPEWNGDTQPDAAGSVLWGVESFPNKQKIAFMSRKPCLRISGGTKAKAFRVMEASEVRRLQRIPCRQVLQEIFNGKFIELKNGMLRYKR